MIDIMQVEVADLVIHPLLDSIPEMPEDCAERRALVASVEEEGIMQPLLIQNLRVVDGRHRLYAARKVGLTTVPCMEVKGDAATIIIDSLTQRRHYTKSAIVMSALPLLEAYTLAGIDRRAENLKNPNVSRNRISAISGTTSEILSRRLGVSSRLLDQARAVQKYLNEIGDWQKNGTDMSIREWVFKMVFVGEETDSGEYKPMGLGTILKGLGGKKRSENPGFGEDLSIREQADYQISKHLKNMNTHWKRWEALPYDAKRPVLDGLRDVVGEWPQDFKAAVMVELSRKM